MGAYSQGDLMWDFVVYHDQRSSISIDLSDDIYLACQGGPKRSSYISSASIILYAWYAKNKKVYILLVVYLT